MTRRAHIGGGDQASLRERLHWHVAHALHRDGVGSVIVLHPLAAQETIDSHAAEFGPVIERIREIVRAEDVLEADVMQGLGIVLSATDSDGARAVFRRLMEMLCTSIPPRRPTEVAVPCALGFSASSSYTEHHGSSHASAPDGGEHFASPLEATAKAMVHSAWQPHAVLSLTLPLLGSTNRSVRPAKGDSRITADDTHTPIHELSPASHSPAAGDAPSSERHAESDHTNVAHPNQADSRHHGHLRVIGQQSGAQQASDRAKSEAWRANARALGVPFAHMPTRLTRSCRMAVPAEVATELRAVAIGRTRNTLTIAMRNPADVEAIQRLRAVTGLNIFPVLAAPDELERALRMIGNP